MQKIAHTIYKLKENVTLTNLVGVVFFSDLKNNFFSQGKHIKILKLPQ